MMEPRPTAQTVTALHDKLLADFDLLSDEEKWKVPKAIRAGIAVSMFGAQTKGFLTDEKRQELIKSLQDHYRKALAAEPQILAEGCRQRDRNATFADALALDTLDPAALMDRQAAAAGKLQSSAAEPSVAPPQPESWRERPPLL